MAPAPAGTRTRPTRETARWTEWIIVLAVVLIAATGIVTVLGGDVNRWWKGDKASPGKGPGKTPGKGPGQGPGNNNGTPSGPSGPAIPI